MFYVPGENWNMKNFNAFKRRKIGKKLKKIFKILLLAQSIIEIV